MVWINENLSKEELLKAYKNIEQEIDRPRKDLFSLGVLICETLDCNNCPVKLYNYDTRTEREKIDGTPCVYNLLKWIKDETLKNESNIIK